MIRKTVSNVDSDEVNFLRAAAHPVASADGSVQWMLNQMEDDDGLAEFCRVETLNSLSRS